MNHEIWDQWEQQALKAGVPPELAALGRSVIRDYWQHGKERDADMICLGADRHHDMMLALALQKPGLASARFAAELHADTPDGEMFEQQLADVEARYADSASKPHTGAWYKSAYQLQGCEFRL
ncbi:hypothetical protein ACFQAT_27925 [Undibacterium arcticum]|uniref:Uncharacterized protein n=1 Tax=Undibacterium arcticum TaxID=1762892 RepID=A0ABV7F6P9_9BURK